MLPQLLYGCPGLVDVRWRRDCGLGVNLRGLGALGEGYLGSDQYVATFRPFT